MCNSRSLKLIVYNCFENLIVLSDFVADRTLSFRVSYSVCYYERGLIYLYDKIIISYILPQQEVLTYLFRMM